MQIPLDVLMRNMRIRWANGALRMSSLDCEKAILCKADVQPIAPKTIFPGLAPRLDAYQGATL
jgi:hypothetical protein